MSPDKPVPPYDTPFRLIGGEEGELEEEEEQLEKPQGSGELPSHEQEESSKTTPKLRTQNIVAASPIDREPSLQAEEEPRCRVVYGNKEDQEPTVESHSSRQQPPGEGESLGTVATAVAGTRPPLFRSPRPRQPKTEPSQHQQVDGEAASLCH